MSFREKHAMNTTVSVFCRKKKKEKKNVMNATVSVNVCRAKRIVNTIVSVNVLPRKTCHEHYRFCKCLAGKKEEKNTGTEIGTG